MLIKLFFLFVALKVHDLKSNPFHATMAYCIPILIVSLFSGAPFLSLLVGSVIMVCVSLVYFVLLTKFNKGVDYYVIMSLGGLLLVLFI
jgi:hypothetical protein